MRYVENRVEISKLIFKVNFDKYYVFLPSSHIFIFDTFVK